MSHKIYFLEQTFVNKDAVATLKLGQARGIAMLAPARAGLPVGEYAPNAVKKAVIGVGHGDKAQIKLMVGMLLPKAKFDTSGSPRSQGGSTKTTRFSINSINKTAENWRRISAQSPKICKNPRP